VGRPSVRSPFLGDPGTRFLDENLEPGTKSEKKKEDRWKLTQLMEKASHKTLSFFTVPTGPATRIFNI
jgi:hypothetical protein